MLYSNSLFLNDLIPFDLSLSEILLVRPFLSGLSMCQEGVHILGNVNSWDSLSVLNNWKSIININLDQILNLFIGGIGNTSLSSLLWLSSNLWQQDKLGFIGLKSVNISLFGFNRSIASSMINGDSDGFGEDF